MPQAHRRVLLLVVTALCSACAASGQRAYVDVDAHLKKSQDLRAAGKHVDAARAFAEFARDFPDDNRAQVAQFWCGEEYFAAGNYNAALAAYEVLNREFADSPYLDNAKKRILEMGTKLLDAGKDRGSEFLERLIELSPSGATAFDAQMALGKYYYNKARYADAKLEFDGAIKDHPPGISTAGAEFGAALAEYRQIDRPAKNMDHLLAAEQSFRHLRTAGLTADEMARVDRYLKEIQNLAAEQHYLMARSYLRQGRLQAAIRHLGEIIENYRTTDYCKPAEELVLFIHEQNRKASK